MLDGVEIVFIEIESGFGYNVIDLDLDEFVTISPWLFVKETDGVHQFVHDGANPEAAVAQCDTLAASYAPHVAGTPSFSEH